MYYSLMCLTLHHQLGPRAQLHERRQTSFPIHRAKKIPIIIRRYLPDGSYEDWSVDELIVE